jgi:hypothetical protein
MKEDDEINSVRRLRCTHTALESRDLSNDFERLPPQARPVNHSMSEDASRFGLRLVGEISEATRLHPTRKRIKRGIVWHVAYSVWLTHPAGLAVCLQSSNHAEHAIISSSPITRYTH